MPSPTCTAEPINAEAERLWREIGSQVREACILRRQGRHRAAAEILDHELPPLIRCWAAECALPTAAAKEQLSKLFNEEQARVESHWIIARFLAEDRAADSAVRHLTAFPSAPDALPASLASLYAPPAHNAALLFPAIPPRRIPIADVTAMIDAARDLERATACRPLSS